MDIVIKRVYDEPNERDGYRVLVDRLWPRGIKKELLALDEWCKNIAPSSELRTWFDHKSERFEEFSERYLQELHESNEASQLLKRAEGNAKITLLYAAKNPKINHAVVLERYLKTVSST